MTQIGDTTGAGNTCDVATDTVGCIISQNLLVPDVTADEITAAVANVAVDASAGAASNATAAVSCTRKSELLATSPAQDLQC